MPDDLLISVRAVLTTTPTRWENLTATLPADLLTREPAPGEWSALGCLRHLLEAERYVFPARVRAFLAGQDFQNWDPDAGQGENAATQSDDPVELATQFARYRYESLRLLDSLTPADLARTATHSEFGTVSLEQMLNEWAAHDLNHTIQAERALMQPFVRAAGPWRELFADYDTERNGHV